MFRIGPYQIGSQTVLAPMAGVSDMPFRSLCAQLGAGLVVNEMVTSDTRLWHTSTSRVRLMWTERRGPRSVQIAGSEPQQMADAARACVDLGAEIVDINMGCPAKKVCNKAAGSALLQNEPLVREILNAVTSAVKVPVTLKIRTGWDTENRNARTIGRIAQDAGIAALTIHGRTRACRFAGEAEYDTIAAVVADLAIPVIANGDIDTPHKARNVLLHTGAAAVMIGRAAQGNPWLFREINAFLADGTLSPAPALAEIEAVLLDHLRGLHDCYGAFMGCRIARKHLVWYLEKSLRRHLPAGLDTDAWRQNFNSLNTPEEQLNAVRHLFARLNQLEDQAA
ncbi:MAG: tRNA dihydrouridine synthase DusB [Cellvibrionaceae bacterium]|nr:tRNA dihydrouridine synthase DusB [Cellvibrionaceae bacterium]